MSEQKMKTENRLGLTRMPVNNDNYMCPKPIRYLFLVILLQRCCRGFIFSLPSPPSQTNEFIRQNIGIWCQEWVCDTSIRMMHLGVGAH